MKPSTPNEQPRPDEQGERKLDLMEIELPPPTQRIHVLTPRARTSSHSEEEVAHLLRGADVHDIQELKRQGLSITQIAAHTGFNRRTIRKYLAQPATPCYGPRTPRTTKLEPFHAYLKGRLQAGVW